MRSSSARTLWRGIRGELPDWLWDNAAEPAFCEPGFFSSSTSIATAIEYLAPDRPNTLLEVVPNMEGHDWLSWQAGVVVSSLSQFACEEEVLFAPCLLFELLEPHMEARFGRSQPTGGTANDDRGRRAVAARFTRVASHDVDPRLQAAIDSGQLDPRTIVFRVRPHVAPWF